MTPFPWNDARRWLEARWGGPVSRVGVDAGLGCPHRVADDPATGCAFCSESSNRPPYQNPIHALENQVRGGIEFAQKRYGAHLFSLYFQGSSSTWAPVDRLRELYDRALACGSFVDLTVGTRPDCLEQDVVDLLASYRSPQREVWVEVGLQSSCDQTLRAIGRGHSAEDFRRSVGRLRGAGLPATAHLMFGLPGETPQDFQNSLDFALDCGVSGVKFHDLILVPGTRLHELWKADALAPVDPECYLDAVATALARLPPEIVVWRVCSDPQDRKQPAAPGVKWPKNLFLNRLRDAVVARKTASGV